MSIFNDDALTQGQRLVWFAVEQLATGDLCRMGPTEIADHMGSARAHVSRAISALSDQGWIERTESGALVLVREPERDESEDDRDSQSRNRDSESQDKGSEPGFPLSALPFSPKKVHSTPFEPSHLSPSQVDLEPLSAAPPPWLRPSDRWESVKEPLPDDHPARWDHLPGDWTFEFAAAAMTHLQELDLLATPTENKIDREGEDFVVSQWADTFRLLHEQDGYDQGEIKETMQWLFEGGNFWIEKQAIRSVPPLRSKTKNGDAYKFDVMYQQAHSTSNGRDRDEDAKQRPEENWKRLARAAAGA